MHARIACAGSKTDVRGLPAVRARQVVANLNQHASSELRADYLSDAATLRTLAARVVQPAHVCRRNETAAAARSCAMRSLNGPAFVATLERWVRLGHITVDEGGAKPSVNATALIESYAAHFDAFMRWRCGEIKALLDKMARKLKGRGCPVAGCPRISAKVNEKLALLVKASISHMVDRKEFWTLPGKGPCHAPTKKAQGPTHAHTLARARAPRDPWRPRQLLPAARLTAMNLSALRRSGHPDREAEPRPVAGVPRLPARRGAGPWAQRVALSRASRRVADVSSGRRRR